MALDRFERLEEGLSRLLAGYETLAAENRGLKDALEVKDRQITELKDKVAKLDAEKGEVRDRVDGLIEKLEGLIQGA